MRLFLLLILAWPVGIGLAQPPQALPDRLIESALQEWAGDIVDLESKAAGEPSDPEAVLVLGSSSIRLWGDEKMASALAPYRTRRRGYGGAKYVDLAVFAKRLLLPEQYQALVLFAGNDIRGQADDQDLADVELSLRHLIDVSQSHRPKSPILIIEVTATPDRFHARDALIELNHLLRRVALQTPGVHFLPTWDHYLGDDGQPRDELFGDDRLHQSEAGYAIWSRLIRDRLDLILTK